MITLLYVCPCDLKVSPASFVEFIKPLGLLNDEWEVFSSSNVQCVAVASALASCTGRGFAIDYRWDCRRLTACQPVSRPGVTYLSQWTGPEDEQQFLSRLEQVVQEQFRNPGKHYVILLDRDVMNRMSKSKNCVIWNEGYSVSQEEFEQSVHEFVLISAQGDITAISTALKRQAFIEGTEWTIESSGEDHCVSLHESLGRVLETEAIVDYMWNGPHDYQEPKKGAFNYANSEWPRGEDSKSFQQRILSNSSKFQKGKKYLVIVDKDAFHVFTGQDTGVAVINCMNGRFQLMQLLSLEQLQQRQKVALVCAEDCADAARKVLTELLQQFPEEQWSVVSSSNPQCSGFAAECAQMLQTKLCVDYQWDEFHKRGKSEEPPRLEEAIYVSDWFNNERSSEFQNRINNCLKLNFRPKIVCVCREVFAHLKLEANVGLAVIDPSSLQLLFKVTTEVLNASESSPQERLVRNLTAQIVGAVEKAFGSSSEFVPLKSVAQTVADVLPGVLTQHLQSVHDRYKQAIKESNEALEEKIKKWQMDVTQQKEIMAKKIDTAVTQFQNIEQELHALNDFVQSLAQSGVSKRIIDLTAATRELRTDIQKWHEATETLTNPVQIAYVEGESVVSMNTRLFAIEGAQLLLINSGDEHEVQTTTLVPGQTASLLSQMPDILQIGYMLVWRQGEIRLSTPIWFDAGNSRGVDRVTGIERTLMTSLSSEQLCTLTRLLSDQNTCKCTDEELAKMLQSQ